MQRPPSPALRRLQVLLAAVSLPLLAVVTLLLRPSAELLGTAASSAPAFGAARAGPAQTSPGEGRTVRLTSGGRDRAVLVQEPLGGQRARALVLVLGPHGLTAARTAQDLPLDELRARGYAVAYPSTVDGDWNAGRCCGSPQRAGVDDVAFLRDVRGLLEQRLGVPRGTVALVGYSTGGQMAYRLACEEPGFARALVIVAGSLETDCSPSGRLPATLVVHGLQDGTVPWAATARPIGLLGYAPTPALASLSAYARAAGCRHRVVDRSDGRELLGWPGCRGIPLLTAVGMPGTGHGWAALFGSGYATRFLPQHLETA